MSLQLFRYSMLDQHLNYQFHFPSICNLQYSVLHSFFWTQFSLGAGQKCLGMFFFLNSTGADMNTDTA